MPQISRDEFVRQLWLADFEFTADLANAHKFTRLADGAEILVPKRDLIDSTVVAPSHIGNPSPCCGAHSRLRIAVGGTSLYRCTDCQAVWDRPSGPTRLRLVQ